MNTLRCMAVVAVIAGLFLSSSAAVADATSEVSVAVNGSGSVGSSPAGIDCPGTCDADFARSEYITLTAIPDQDQTFLGWEGDCAGTDPTCDLRTNKDRSVTAAFTAGSPPPPAPVPKTGQTTCYDATGNQIACGGTDQDGDLKTGIAWPNPRFTINSDGTARDNLTGLIWAQQSPCGGGVWQQALNFAATVSNGVCGLTDGSAPGDWRLPNIKEMLSLIDYETGGFPAGSPFNYGGWYWTSTTDVFNTDFAWEVLIGPFQNNSGTPGVRAVDKDLSGASGLVVRGP